MKGEQQKPLTLTLSRRERGLTEVFFEKSADLIHRVDLRC